MTDERRREYADVCKSVLNWAVGRSDIKGVAVVGSWARSEPTMDSDIDLVILTTEKANYSAKEDWASVAVAEPAELIRTQEWGPLTECRFKLASGLEIEFGLVPTTWADTEPLGPGTASVVSNGCNPILDHKGLLEKLVEAVKRAH